MRKMMAAVVLWGAVAFAAGNTGATSKEGGEEGAKQFSQQMDKAWNGKDAKGLSDLFTDKATLISPFGDKGDGRAGVEKLFSRHMEQDLKGTTLRTEVGSVQTVSPDVAVVDLTQ
ncbi:MAG: SgcJ/EcaC family oxidoreductase, partial [Myxococcaceae bacterium]